MCFVCRWIMTYSPSYTTHRLEPCKNVPFRFISTTFRNVVRLLQDGLLFFPWSKDRQCLHTSGCGLSIHSELVRNNLRPTAVHGRRRIVEMEEREGKEEEKEDAGTQSKCTSRKEWTGEASQGDAVGEGEADRRRRIESKDGKESDGSVREDEGKVVRRKV
mmetsp:Transcript_5319/g.33378  ORF Transcript_5319/g.33378 Transcript_5319/m.33378 type:complete len:161 (+) Transcript_5319:387-869(+)